MRRRYSDNEHNYRNYHNYQNQGRPQQHDYERYPGNEYQGRRNEDFSNYHPRRGQERVLDGRYRGHEENYSNQDYYGTLYETTNYNWVPRHEDYGRRAAHREYGGHHTEHFATGPRFSDEQYKQQYHQFHGYDPNLDDPYEGERYRPTDRHGNYGYRHDASYGHSDSMIGFDDGQENQPLPDYIRDQMTGYNGRI